MKSLQCIILCATLSATSGCASLSPNYDGENTRDAQVEETSYGSISASQVSSNTAVQRLYDQAMNYAFAGDFDQAEAALERGLRIEPSNPYLWFELARIAATYGNVNKARELASRAQSYASGERQLQRQIQRFLELL